MKKIAIILTILLLGVFVFACSTTTTPTPTPTKPAVTSAAPPPSSAAPPPATSAPSKTSAAPPSSPTATGNPIKIGAIMSLTGESALSGAGQKIGLQYRLDQIGWQVAGRPIQLVQDDDASSPTTSTDATKKQVLLDKVDVILGPTQGAAAVAAANYMKQSSPAIPIFIVMAKPAVVLKDVTNNNIFLPMGTDAATGWFLGQYAYEKLKYKTTTALLEDMISGYDKVQNGFLAAFQKAGGTSVQQQPVKSGSVDFSPYIAALKPADCVVYWFTPGLTARFTAQYIAAGKTTPLLLPDSTVLLPASLTQIGDKAAGIVSETNYSDLIDTPDNQSYVTDFQKKMGSIPQAQAAGIDMALLVYLEAVKATGGDTTPAKVIDAIHKVKVKTPQGTVAFTPQGMGIGDLFMAQSVKLSDRIDWKILDTFSQIVLDIPAASPTPTK